MDNTNITLYRVWLIGANGHTDHYITFRESKEPVIDVASEDGNTIQYYRAYQTYMDYSTLQEIPLYVHQDYEPTSLRLIRNHNFLPTGWKLKRMKVLNVETILNNDGQVVSQVGLLTRNQLKNVQGFDYKDLWQWS